MVRHQQKISTCLAKTLQSHADAELINLLELGITESVANTAWQPDMDHISDQWKAGIEKQNKIGWHQLLFRRMSKTMEGTERPDQQTGQ
jgi:hypothetical protein